MPSREILLFLFCLKETSRLVLLLVAKKCIVRSSDSFSLFVRSKNAFHVPTLRNRHPIVLFDFAFLHTLLRQAHFLQFLLHSHSTLHKLDNNFLFYEQHIYTYIHFDPHFFNPQLEMMNVYRILSSSGCASTRREEGLHLKRHPLAHKPAAAEK
jgi:hypothetical protein